MKFQFLHKAYYKVFPIKLNEKMQKKHTQSNTNFITKFESYNVF